jgi:hypothetical protein
MGKVGIVDRFRTVRTEVERFKTQGFGAPAPAVIFNSKPVWSDSMGMTSGIGI